MFPEAPVGWFHSSLYNQYQKVDNNVYVYVMLNLSGWQVQLYMRGDISVCTLEARTRDGSIDSFNKMIKIGEQWLETYKNAQLDEIKSDSFYVFNPKGHWGPLHKGKERYIL